jgi:hypothetical protein
MMSSKRSPTAVPMAIEGLHARGGAFVNNF